MKLRLIAAGVAAALVLALPADSARRFKPSAGKYARESRIPVGSASLYARVIGRGQPVIVLHVRGTSSSIKLDNTQLIPTRTGRLAAKEPLITTVVGALLAALIIELFVTRGRIVRTWLKESSKDAA